MNFKNTAGTSLLLGMGFSLAILSSASLISTTITQSQKNVRNIEDVNIAFFAAESGIEESMYYLSFHKNGFQAQNDTTPNFQGYTKITGNIPNIGYKWNIDNRIDLIKCPAGTSYADANEQCKGAILFSKSATWHLAYDNNTKNTTDKTAEVQSPNDISINFTADPSHVISTDFNDGMSESAGDKIIMSWMGSYLYNSSSPYDINDNTTESKILPWHNNDAYVGRRCDTTSHASNNCMLSSVSGDVKIGDPNDCSVDSSSWGKFFCQNELYNIEAVPVVFDVNNLTRGFKENDPTKFDDLDNFFNPDMSDGASSDRKTWRSLKFFYVNLIPGQDASNPPMDTIYYTITPPNTGEPISATKTLISADGRSRNILSTLQTSIDTTEEFTALDYGVLLE